MGQILREIRLINQNLPRIKKEDPGHFVVNYKTPGKIPFRFYYFLLTIVEPAIKATTNNTKKTKNKILAIDAAPAAIPVNPNNAAMSAITRKISDQRNIV